MHLGSRYGKRAPKACYLVATAVRPWIKGIDKLRPAGPAFSWFRLNTAPSVLGLPFLHFHGLTAVATKRRSSGPWRFFLWEVRQVDNLRFIGGIGWSAGLLSLSAARTWQDQTFGQRHITLIPLPTFFVQSYLIGTVLFRVSEDSERVLAKTLKGAPSLSFSSHPAPFRSSRRANLAAQSAQR